MPTIGWSVLCTQRCVALLPSSCLRLNLDFLTTVPTPRYLVAFLAASRPFGSELHATRGTISSCDELSARSFTQRVAQVFYINRRTRLDPHAMRGASLLATTGGCLELHAMRGIKPAERSRETIPRDHVLRALASWYETLRAAPAASFERRSARGRPTNGLWPGAAAATLPRRLGRWLLLFAPSASHISWGPARLLSRNLVPL